MFEPPPSRGGSRFGQLSTNMFFTRNTAKPKRVRHIEGLNGALICSVNDDPSVVRSSSMGNIGLDKINVGSFEAHHRTERFLPPTGFWNTYGVVRDTDRWRQELASLASASGLGIEKTDAKLAQRPATNNDPRASRSGAHYSARTGRFNEGTAKSRGRTGSRHGTAYGDVLMKMPENEREMWMLQVLCQLLGTSNLEDVQSWLVSASSTEKEQARSMINSALQGLKESDRTSQMNNQPVDFDSLTNLVERQKHDEKEISQRFVQDSMQNPSGSQQDLNLRQSWSKFSNNHYPDVSPDDGTTYKTSFQQKPRRSHSSFESTLPLERLDENEEESNPNGEIESRDAQEQGRFSSMGKLHRASSTLQQKHPVESIQFNDEETDGHQDTNPINFINNHNVDQQPLHRDTILPPIKVKDSIEIDENNKSRKIRQLQNRLSNQEEEAKRQLTELQSKQSRLENAIKLLTKNNLTSKKTASSINNEDSNSEQSSILSKQPAIRRSFKLQTIQNNSTDDRLSKSNSGIWKPEAALLHRLQEN